MKIFDNVSFEATHLEHLVKNYGEAKSLHALESISLLSSISRIFEVLFLRILVLWARCELDLLILLLKTLVQVPPCSRHKVVVESMFEAFY